MLAATKKSHPISRIEFKNEGLKFTNFKIRYIYSILLLLAVIFLVNCNPGPPKTEVLAEKESTEYFSFFKKGLPKEAGKPDLAFAEISAVTFDGENLIFGNEDPVNISPQKILSPIFEMPYKNFPSSKKDFYPTRKFMNARKFEDLTMLSDQSGAEYVVATTAFDRVKSKYFPDGDSYNTLLIWPKGNPDEVKMVDEFESESNGYKSSMAIRKALFNALGICNNKDNKYYAVEGLTAIPNNKLLFGIRKFGKDYENFEYTITIISADYSIDKGDLTLNNFQIVFEIDPKTIRNKTGWNTVGLSSLEFDKYNNRLYMLTSFEKCESTYDDIGAYLWVLSVDNNSLISDPIMVIDKKTSKPLMFNHKAEGIAVISASELFVVHDDDTIVTYVKPDENGNPRKEREPHQVAYTKVKIVN